jgi:hypothetical protein
VLDEHGKVMTRGRVSNDAAGFAALLTLLAEAGDTADQPIPVGTETDRGLIVAALRETGRVINPLAASRFRGRYAVSGAKSDACEAVLLARHHPHRPSQRTVGGVPVTGFTRSWSATVTGMARQGG